MDGFKQIELKRKQSLPTVSIVLDIHWLFTFNTQISFIYLP